MRKLAALALACWAVSAARQDAPVATVTGGNVRGAAGEGVDTFKGIPFAAPPVGPPAGGRPSRFFPGRRSPTRPPLGTTACNCRSRAMLRPSAPRPRKTA